MKTIQFDDESYLLWTPAICTKLGGADNFFSHCHWVGRKKGYGLVQILHSSWHCFTNWGSVKQRNVIHFQIVAPASINYSCALANLWISEAAIESVVHISRQLINRYKKFVVNVAYYNSSSGAPHCDVASWCVKTIVGFELNQTFILYTQMTKKKKWSGHVRLLHVLLWRMHHLWLHY